MPKIETTKTNIIILKQYYMQGGHSIIFSFVMVKLGHKIGVTRANAVKRQKKNVVSSRHLLINSSMTATILLLQETSRSVMILIIFLLSICFKYLCDQWHAYAANALQLLFGRRVIVLFNIKNGYYFKKNLNDSDFRSLIASY